MSSFRRAAPAARSTSASLSVPAPAAAVPGTRRWVDGTLLVSTGHKELDAIVGGGVAVGSVVLIEQDFSRTHASTLCELFVAEGIASAHAVTVCALEEATATDMLGRLPQNVSRDSRDLDALESEAKAAAAEAHAGWDTSGDGLKVAGSYRKYLPATGARVDSLGSTLSPSVPSAPTRYCHTFDLNARMTPAVLQAADVSVLAPKECCDTVPAACFSSDGYVWDCNTFVAAPIQPPASPQRRFRLSLLSPVSHVVGAEVPDMRPVGADASVHDGHLSTPESSGNAWSVFAGLIRSLRTRLVRVGSPTPAGSAPSSPPIHRVVVLGLAEPSWPGSVDSVRLAAGHAAAAAGSQCPDGLDSAESERACAPLVDAMHSLRALARPQLPASAGCGGCVVLVTAALQHLPHAVAARVRSLCDVVLKVHAFTDPPAALAPVTRYSAPAAATAGTAGTAPEFAEYHGLLLVRRVVRPGCVAGPAADTLTYCFKRDRRKLVIEKPHLPPEDNRTAAAPAARGGTGAHAATAGRAAAAAARNAMKGDASASHAAAAAAAGSGSGADASQQRQHRVAVESDEMEAALPTAADVAAALSGGGGGGGMSCASSGSAALDF